jgi:undecaprenyl-diphosphatase
MSGAIGYLDSVILGVVEGLTEFLPVSSTGHLTVVEGLMGIPLKDAAVTAYTAIIQFGATVATFIYFRSDILRLVRALLRGLRSSEARQDSEFGFATAVVLGSMPIVVVALLAQRLITDGLRNLWIVAASLILWSPVMVLAERLGRRKYSETELSLRQVLGIGLAQCVALVPGVSRSGATISAGLFAGATRVAATRLSFFLAIPALTGAGLYELRDVDPTVVGWGPLLVGVLISFAVAYLSIAWLLRLVAHHSISVFVGYRVAIGCVIIVLLLTGTVTADGTPPVG